MNGYICARRTRFKTEIGLRNFDVNSVVLYDAIQNSMFDNCVSEYI